MEIDHQALGLAVRWLHVAAMATAFGGALLVAALPIDDLNDGAWLAAAARYEIAFWAAIGLLALSGVGNLATFGAGLAPPASDWGRIFMVKLGSVIVLAVLSLPRTLAIAQLREGAGQRTGDGERQARRMGEGGRRALRRTYVATMAGLAAIAALAVVLAHG